jgi:hypothetical protein
MSLHAGAGSRAECFTYPESAPILDISASATISVAICIAGNGADDAALAFARELARQAGRFAAEVERMHAGNGGKAAEGEAA